MAADPHEETPLTEYEKAAYRRLLYWAMVDIRNLCLSRGPATCNPLEIWRQYHRSRVAGALADWLHNLAFYAACDFRGFNTDQFWREQTGMARRFPQFRPDNYLDYWRRYNEDLARLKKEQESV